MALAERNLGAKDREDDQAQAVQCEEERSEVLHDARDRNRDDRCRHDQQQEFRVTNPGERVVPQQHIADRAAAQRGDQRHHHHPEQVHPFATGRQLTGHPLGGDPDRAEHREQLENPPSAPADRGEPRPDQPGQIGRGHLDREPAPTTRYPDGGVIPRR